MKRRDGRTLQGQHNMRVQDDKSTNKYGLHAINMVCAKHYKKI